MACSGGVLSSDEVAIEQAIARYGSVQAAIARTGVDPALAAVVYRRMESRCSGDRPRKPSPVSRLPERPLVLDPAPPDVITAIQTGGSLKALARQLLEQKHRATRRESYKRPATQRTAVRKPQPKAVRDDLPQAPLRPLNRPMPGATAVVRVYRPSERRTQACHLTPAAITEGGLTMCGKSTRGMAGRAPEEHTLASTMRVCVDCLDHLGHPAMIR